MVFVVNMLSPRKCHVSIGKVKYDIEKIRNLGPHTCPISSYAMRTPYKKQSPVGSPYMRTASIGRSLHQSQTNWLLIWNQAIDCPKANSVHANKSLEVGNYDLLTAIAVLDWLSKFVNKFDIKSLIVLGDFIVVFIH